MDQHISVVHMLVAVVLDSTIMVQVQQVLLAVLAVVVQVVLVHNQKEMVLPTLAVVAVDMV
jgi:hypothetical protein